MPGWAIWTIVGVGAWFVVSISITLLFSRTSAVFGTAHDEAAEETYARLALKPERLPAVAASARRRILLVDDDADLRLLLRTTLAADECAVEEAASAEEAAELARFWRPSAVVLDVGLPGMSGLIFCRELKSSDVYGSPGVVLLTGGDTSHEEALRAGADALLRKPFSPLDLMAMLDYVLGRSSERLEAAEVEGGDQLLAYARDISRLAQVERAQRRLLQQAYRQTITALTDALEVRNEAMGHHALRVHRYAVELTDALEPSLLDDPSLEYGFLLHDIGKIGVPDSILDKKGPLRPRRTASHAAASADRRRAAQRHPAAGRRGATRRPLAPRALGREWLSGGPCGRRDFGRRADFRPRRRAGCNDERAAVSRDAELGERCRRGPARERLAIRPRGRPGLRPPGTAPASNAARPRPHCLTPATRRSRRLRDDLHEQALHARSRGLPRPRRATCRRR